MLTAGDSLEAGEQGKRSYDRLLLASRPITLTADMPRLPLLRESENL